MTEKNVTHYYLGEEYPGIYFTEREVQCLQYLLAGHTLMSTAELLDLSARTIEFYVRNMRMKIGAATKVDLLEKIKEIDFMERINLDKKSEILYNHPAH